MFRKKKSRNEESSVFGRYVTVGFIDVCVYSDIIVFLIKIKKKFWLGEEKKRGIK